jgi:hypothetical protein
MRTPFLVLLCAFTAACAQKPPPTLSCQFVQHPLTVEDPAIARGDATMDAILAGPSPAPALALPADDPVDDIGVKQTTLGQEIQASIARDKIEKAAGSSAAGSPTPERYSMLFMSGGSENGAFGAGFLDAWRLDSPGRSLPRFQIVTGISTGAILGLFAFTGETEKAVSGYAIDRESQLLTPFVKFKDGEPTPVAYLKIARRGALANLVPLRARIAERIDEGMLRKLADGYAAGRRYFVGVVDVDSGDSVVLDMTEMASRYFQTSDPGRRAGVRGCMVEAIAASSSAPLAAPPAFIDNRMYIDGGARFGVFSAEIGEALRKEQMAPVSRGAPPLPPRYYVVVNGDQLVSQICGKKEKALCTNQSPTGGGEGVHRKWNILDLALRSEKILANQVYRFSVERIDTMAGNAGSPLRFVKIGKDADDHQFELDDPVLGSGTHSCAQWSTIDDATMNPVQFHPRFMRCLINYGRVRAKIENWAADAS